MSTIRIEGIEPLLRKIKTLEQFKQVGDAVQLAGVHMKGLLNQHADDTQGQAHHAQPFKTEKSRRFFFWALREGKIEVPYRRGMSPGSQSMSHGWNVERRNNGLTAAVTNSASYGPLVMGPGKQASYHKQTGWKTTDQMVAKHRKSIIAFVRKAIERILS